MIPNFPPNLNLVEYKSDIFYPNGTKKYESFFRRFFHPDGKKVYDDFHKDFNYSNGQKAYDGFHNHVFYANGKKAYDGFFKMGYYDNGNKAGSDGININASAVCMRLNGAINEFWISLGNNFYVLIKIFDKNPSFKLFLDGNLVFQK